MMMTEHAEDMWWDAVDSAMADEDDEAEAYGYWAEDKGFDGGWDDVEADADTLAGVGWGMDEDYGYYGEPPF